MSVYSRLNLNLEVLVIKEREKPEYPEKILSEPEREPTINQPTYGRDTRIQTWVTLVDLWKASALTIVPPLLINIAAETKIIYHIPSLS